MVHNLYYNAEEDYYVCPMGQHIRKKGDVHRVNEGWFYCFLQPLYALRATMGAMGI